MIFLVFLFKSEKVFSMMQLKNILKDKIFKFFQLNNF